jgi:hypothetical protein
MKDISNKNNQRYPVVEAGQAVIVLDAKIPSLNGLEGVIVEAPRIERSPHKAIYKVEIAGRAGPWYLFRTEFQPSKL